VHAARRCGVGAGSDAGSVLSARNHIHIHACCHSHMCPHPMNRHGQDCGRRLRQQPGDGSRHQGRGGVPR
jgi:hypothetical protein